GGPRGRVRGLFGGGGTGEGSGVSVRRGSTVEDGGGATYGKEGGSRRRASAPRPRSGEEPEPRPRRPVTSSWPPGAPQQMPDVSRPWSRGVEVPQPRRPAPTRSRRVWQPG